MIRSFRAGLIGIGVSASLSGCGGSAPSTSQTEQLFQDSLGTFSYSEIHLDEWRQARSDHKQIAYAILNCRKLPIDNMSRQTFSSLFLDLAPNGDHVFRVPGSSNPAQKSDAPSPPESDANPLILTSHEQRLLSLSDAISRTRVAAAKNVGSSANSAFWLSLAALVVSGFTTLFVTLQSRGAGSQAPNPNQAPAQDHGNDGAPPGQPPAAPIGGWSRRAAFTIALLAIIFSIVGTVLTGIKQFYDPTKLVVQNGKAIQRLNSLHQAITQGLECKGDDKPSVDYSDDAPVKDWALQIENIRSTILASYGTFGSDPIPSNQPPPAPQPPKGTPP